MSNDPSSYLNDLMFYYIFHLISMFLLNFSIVASKMSYINFCLERIFIQSTLLDVCIELDTHWIHNTYCEIRKNATSTNYRFHSLEKQTNFMY